MRGAPLPVTLRFTVLTTDQENEVLTTSTTDKSHYTQVLTFSSKRNVFFFY